MVHDCFGSLGFGSSEVLCTSLRKPRSSFPRTLGSAATCPPQYRTAHAHFGFRDFGPLTNNFNNISNPRFLQTVDLIFSGMSAAEADLAYCLHFEPEMDCSECCTWSSMFTWSWFPLLKGHSCSQCDSLHCRHQGFSSTMFAGAKVFGTS
jgi:hypothetical protein